MRAVLRAADSERASLFEMGSGGASCPSYAATYPERVQSLILVNLRQSYPELRWALGSPEEASRDEASESGAVAVREPARCA